MIRNRETGIPIAAERAAAVRGALERIVASDVLRNAPQLARFLVFVVEETLEGRAAELKGYTIATQALGRPEDFDPQIDPIVRVEAMRLRRALEAYYAGPGRADPVTIDIPRGTYEPNFAIGDEKSARSTWVGAGQKNAHELHRGRAFVAAAIAIGLLVSVFVAAHFNPVVSHPHKAVSVRLAALPTVIIEPIVVERDVPQDFSDRRFRLILSDALARFDEIGVIDPRTTDIAPQPTRPVNGVYSLFVFVSAVEAGLDVIVQLVRQPDGGIVWSRRFIEPAQGSSPFSPDLPSSIAAIIAQPSGVLFADLRERGDVSLPARCMLTVFAYWADPSEPLHAAARECVERFAVAQPRLAIAHALLALLNVDGRRMAYDARPDSVARALGAAKRAISLSPESARAHHALMAALLARGDMRAALETGARAVLLNPNDSKILYDVGAMLVLAGDYSAGVEMIQRARRISPRVHARYDFYFYLGEYMKSDGEAEDQARAADKLQALLAIEPDFESDPGQVLARRGLNPDVAARLLAGLDHVEVPDIVP